MAELMGREFHGKLAQYRPLDRNLDGSLSSRLAFKCDKHCIGMLARHRRDNLVAVDLKTFSKHRRNFELEANIVFRFIIAEREESRFATALRPMQMPVEAQRR